MPGGSLDSIAQLITILLIFAAVLVATFFVTKWIAGYQRIAGSGNTMEVVEVCRISPSQVLQIVRIGDRYVVIAVSKDSVSFVTGLSEGEYHRPEKASASGGSFKEILGRVSGKTDGGKE